MFAKLNHVVTLFFLAALATNALAQPPQSRAGEKIPGAFIVELRGECTGACRGQLQAALASDPSTSGCSLGPTGAQIGDLTFEDVKCPPGRNVQEDNVIVALSPQSNTGDVPEVVVIAQDEVVELAATATSYWGVDEADGGVAIVSGSPQRDGLRTCSMRSNNGVGVNVWILDTGCFPANGGFCGGYYGDSNRCVDRNGHGTHVGGTATDPTYGVAPAARRSCVKVLGDDGFGTYSTIIQGIQLATYYRNSLPRGDVINLSLGGSRYQPLNDAVIASRNLGLYFALAAGNESDNACNYSPASTRGAGIFTVQAHDRNLRPYYLTNYATTSAKCTDLSAPGVGITSFGGTWSGTSMAAPHVAGACALLLSNGIVPTVGSLTARGVTISISGACGRRTLGVTC